MATWTLEKKRITEVAAYLVDALIFQGRIFHQPLPILLQILAAKKTKKKNDCTTKMNMLIHEVKRSIALNYTQQKKDWPRKKKNESSKGQYLIKFTAFVQNYKLRRFTNTQSHTYNNDAIIITFLRFQDLMIFWTD